jgi:hypothetical protein
MRLLILLLALWCPTVVYAHDSPLDAYGCHSNKLRFANTTSRECHVGLLNNNTYTSVNAEYQGYIMAQGLLIESIKADVARIKAKVMSFTSKWNANTEPSLLGYRIYCGTQSGVYSIQVEVAKTLLTTDLLNLSAGTYYCVVKAYNAVGESAPSVEVMKVMP